MRLVIVESPYKAASESELRRNTAYVRACLHDCLIRGDAPFASHALYTLPGVLHDDVPEERRLGMEAGFAWISVAHATVVYTDFGVSPGMQHGIDTAISAGRSVEYRQLPPDVLCKIAALS